MTENDHDTGNTPALKETKVTDEELEISFDQLAKLALEIGPLLVFFATNFFAGIFWGISTFMVATVVALTVSRIKFGRIPVMPLVTGIFVMVFGAIALWSQNDEVFKLKPTILNGLFATILLFGLAFGKSLLKYIFGEIFKLTDEGWRILTLRWALFFVFLAILNEIVRLNFSTDFWVWFKVLGLVPITIVFGVAQLSLIQKYELK